MRRNIVKVLCILLTCATVLSAAFFVSCRVGEGGEETAGISFTDALGQEITVKKNPERVAALLGSFADVQIPLVGDLTNSGWTKAL